MNTMRFDLSALVKRWFDGLRRTLKILAAHAEDAREREGFREPVRACR